MHSTDALSVAAQPAIGPGRGLLDRLARHRGLATWALILLLPIIAVSTGHIFHKADPSGMVATTDLDSIAWPRNTPPTQRPQPSGTATTSAAPVASLIAGLEQRLAGEPTDPKGWALLAQSYSFLGDTQRAESAIAKAVALGLDETELRRRVSLASATPANVEATAMAQTPGVIRGIVRLADGDSMSVPPQSRLFVTAKATDGSTMPVAVIASHVTRFPYQFTLSDDNSMLPGATLTELDEISVSAWISLAGTATRSAADIESTAQIVQVASPGWVELVLEN